jgi:hypothetical protein
MRAGTAQARRTRHIERASFEILSWSRKTARAAVCTAIATHVTIKWAPTSGPVSRMLLASPGTEALVARPKHPTP